MTFPSAWTTSSTAATAPHPISRPSCFKEWPRHELISRGSQPARGGRADTRRHTLWRPLRPTRGVPPWCRAARRSWHDTAEAVAAAGFQAICADHRGHGDSEWPHEAEYEFGDYADDVDELLSQLDEPPVMVGASLGGIAILTSHGRQHDQRYRGVVLVDITPRIDIDGAQRILGFMGANPEGFDTLEDASAVIAAYAGRPRPDRLDGLQKVLRMDPLTNRWRWHWDIRFLHGRLGGDTLREPYRRTPISTARRSESSCRANARDSGWTEQTS